MLIPPQLIFARKSIAFLSDFLSVYSFFLLLLSLSVCFLPFCFYFCMYVRRAVCLVNFYLSIASILWTLPAPLATNFDICVREAENLG